MRSHFQFSNALAALLAHATKLLPLLLLLTLPAVVQAQFNYTTDNGTITITGYTGPGGAVTIPSTINGLPVTRIGDQAFYGSTSLTSITIPNSVTSISDFAFGSCTSLSSVTIPSSVNSIGVIAFISCTSLTAITVDALNSAYSSVDGVLFDKSQTTLIQCPARKAGSYTIPNSVTSIGFYAFYVCTSLTSVTIGNSVTNIGNNAFSGCRSLTNVTIGNSVINIAYGAFSGCSSLTSVMIPNSVTSIGGVSFPALQGAFSACSSLTNVTIGNSVTSIGSGAFHSCTSLTSITIPNSVTFIGREAFLSCTSLTSVTIGNSVTSIGHWAFRSCTSLTGVYFQGNAPSVGFDVFDGADAVTVYYLPGSTDWETAFAGRPTALWLPEARTTDADFGVRTNQFGFNIRWASDKVVVVEASPDLSNHIWTPVSTNTLTGGSAYFSDPQWTNHPSRFYRLVSPVP